MLEAAVARDPKNAALKGDLIRAEAELAGLAAGVARARAFAESDPENSLYDIVSAELYEKAGRKDKALAARPTDAGLIVALSRLYAHNGDPARGRGTVE